MPVLMPQLVFLLMLLIVGLGVPAAAAAARLALTVATGDWHEPAVAGRERWWRAKIGRIVDAFSKQS